MVSEEANHKTKRNGRVRRTENPKTEKVIINKGLGYFRLARCMLGWLKKLVAVSILYHLLINIHSLPRQVWDSFAEKIIIEVQILITNVF